jgi:hypothetical protein
MNIFYLSHDPKVCAEQHCDKHVVKMILEYAQLLSTAHRVIDGTASVGLSKTGRKQTSYVLDDQRETVLYRASHINHPSAVWARQSKQNYTHLYELMGHLCKEYTRRYGKTHKSEDLMFELYIAPRGISVETTFTQPPPAMPDYCKVPGDSVASYRNYYIKEKSYMAKWKTKQPDWFVKGMQNNANV